MATKKILNPRIMKININTAELRTLSSLRDTLLPKLLSGALNVQEIRS